MIVVMLIGIMAVVGVGLELQAIKTVMRENNILLKERNEILKHQL